MGADGAAPGALIPAGSAPSQRGGEAVPSLQPNGPGVPSQLSVALRGGQTPLAGGAAGGLSGAWDTGGGPLSLLRVPGGGGGGVGRAAVPSCLWGWRSAETLHRAAVVPAQQPRAGGPSYPGTEAAKRGAVGHGAGTEPPNLQPTGPSARGGGAARRSFPGCCPLTAAAPLEDRGRGGRGGGAAAATRGRDAAGWGCADCSPSCAPPPPRPGMR